MRFEPYQESNLKAPQSLVDFTIELLKEMGGLEAGFYLRDSGYNFPVTMDAIKKATQKRSNNDCESSTSNE